MRQRSAQWTVIIASLVYALVAMRYSWGGPAAYLLALLPAILAAMVARSWLAGAFMILLPMYFVIGQMTAHRPHFQPFTALDRAMPLSPHWMLVYGSLYMAGFLLPLVVVRGRQRFLQAMKAYLFVMLVSYAGFVAYPTIAPRAEPVTIAGFATWCLQLFYDLDQPYGCFPSLHVAFSLVGAIACYGVHRGVGLSAAAWALLIGVSTVYTKQHFAVDAIAGTVIGLCGSALFLRTSPSEAFDERDRWMAPRRAFAVVGAYAIGILMFWSAYLMGLGPASR
jgi:membrane-associated phospholipid phosphatase